MVSKKLRIHYRFIDYIITNEEAKKTILDIRTCSGYNVGTDPRLVKGKIRLKLKETTEKKKKKEKVLNTRALNDPTTKWLFRNRMEILEKVTPPAEYIDEERASIKKIIMAAAEEALGTRCKPTNPKKIPIWNEEVAKAIQDKQNAWKKWRKS